MNAAEDRSVICSDCGKVLPGGDKIPKVPCPNCGSTKRTINICLNDTIHLSDKMYWERVREFYEKNHSIKAVIIAIAVLSPFLGLFVAGIPGVVVGLFLSAASYFLGPSAVTKVREITRGG